MFEKEWLPYALSIGVSYDEFWRMNPHILKAFEEAHRLKIIEQDNLMWTWWGNYGLSAVSVAIEHNLAGQKAKSEYIKNPVLQEYTKTSDNSNKESNEECAVFEMKQRINLLRQQGLPESPI